MCYSFSNIDEIFESNDLSGIDLILLESIKSLLKMNEFHKAYGLAKLIQPGYEAAEALIIIAENLNDSDNRKNSIELLKKAGTLLLHDTYLWQKAELLCRIACSFQNLGMDVEATDYFIQAIEFARKGEMEEDRQNSLDSSSVLAEIAYKISSNGNKDWALELAESIRSQGKRENAIKAIN